MTSITYPPITSSRILNQLTASLLLYQSIFENEIGEAFLSLLQTLHNTDEARFNASVVCIQSYGKWFKALASHQKSWQDYLMREILLNDNPFSHQVQHQEVKNLSPSLIIAVKQDLQILQSIYYCTPQQIGNWVKIASQMQIPLISWELDITTTSFLNDYPYWEDSLEDLATHYRQNGTGIMAKYQALKWDNGKLEGIKHPDTVQLSEIVGYEAQKQALIQNTEFLLAGYNALHVLLYGSRGSGKSSLVKSLLQKFAPQGLRLIEVSQSQLQDLPVILEKLRNLPQKFVIFVDDLSFEEDNEGFRQLKVILEGRITAKAQNVVVYATSNRRHLVKELFSDRPVNDSEEIHLWDTVQEKLSFSDRFGLTLTFEAANQKTYLEIVHHLAKNAKINLDQDTLEFRAKQWATQHNGRSGRTAKQFIDFLQAEIALSRHVTD
jgi:predicted AAA+ superfamily ATPase